MYSSEKMLFQFSDFPDNQSLKDAFVSIFEPLGFQITFNENNLDGGYLDKTSEFYNISITSDEWGSVWGDADPWGSLESNRKYINMLDELLIKSGRFEKIIE